MYIPPGYGTIVPYIFVDKPLELLTFLQNTFDAEELGRSNFPNGEIANLRVRIGTTSFMVGAAAQHVPHRPGVYKLYVEDADQSYARALENGATGEFPPTPMWYGDKQGGVTDPCGNTWFICTRNVHQPYDPVA